MLERLCNVFSKGGRLNWALLATYIAINVLVLLNVSLHDPYVGYDAHGHLKYVEVLAEPHLPTLEDTHEFFSAPLPYVAPAIAIGLLGMDTHAAGKVGQFANVLLSLLLTGYLVRLCRLISDNGMVALGALVALGMLPVYYKSFAMFRGETYVACFVVIALYYLLRIHLQRDYSARTVIALGVSLGLCALSRQWGILFFPAAFLFLGYQWLTRPGLRFRIVRATLLCLALIFLTAGWFYLTLQFRYGSITAFNQKAVERFSLGNKPASFYFQTSHWALRHNPLRDAYPDQFLPIIYSDTWGDYWCYFLVYGKDKRTGEPVMQSRLPTLALHQPQPNWLETNFTTIAPYLGRVNTLAAVPSLLAFIALILAVASLTFNIQPYGSIMPRHPKEIIASLLLALASILAGYFWFLLRHPSTGSGDTIKATYILQLYPVLAILFGLLVARIRVWSPIACGITFGFLGLILIHNLPAMVTRNVAPW